MSKQILNELQDLEEAGVIDSGISNRIKEYYVNRQPPGSANRINIVFAILGTILVSLGIILVIAHNWDQLSRSLKLFFAFLPLVIGQLLCVFTLRKHPLNRLWLECSAVFLFFAVGACLAMVSQVYHIAGDAASFVFLWMLLVFPLIYIMRSSISSLLYILGITAHATFLNGIFSNAENYHYCWLILLVLPFYVLLIKNQPKANFTGIHHWLVPLSLIWAYGFIFGDNNTLFIAGYFCLFSAFYLFGSYADFLPKSLLGNGYLVLGSVGSVFLLLFSSFQDFWKLSSLQKTLLGELFGTPAGWSTIFFFALAGRLAFYYIIQQKRTVNWMGLIYIPYIVVFFAFAYTESLAALCINILTLLAGLATINRGNKLNHLGILNYGLSIIALLVVCRFFDDQISFVIRGLMFIGVGIGFFIANSRFLKKRKLHEK